MKKIYALLTSTILATISLQGFSQDSQPEKRSLAGEGKSIQMDTKDTSLIQIVSGPVDVTTFPNPASKSLTFTLKGVDFSKVEIEIFELTGQPVMTVNPDNSQYTIDISTFREGMYFYKVVSMGTVLVSEKFIVLKK